jgi:hypothetical protein
MRPARVATAIAIAAALSTASTGAEPPVRYRSQIEADIAARQSALPAPPPSSLDRAGPASPRYDFKLLTTVIDGHSAAFEPAISSTEIVFVTNPEHPHVTDPYYNVFSTERGYLTDSTTGSLQAPDVADTGEAVYADTHEGFGFGVFSTAAGLVRNRGNQPSVADSGEIVYARDGPGGDGPPPWPPPTLREIVSTTRGVLVSGTAWVDHPSVNGSGEVVYVQAGTGVVSTVRGTIVPEPAAWPSIADGGEIVYIAPAGGTWQLFSTARGQITFGDSFPEPAYADADCDSPFGHYQNGVGGQTDVNDRGEIVFSRWLLEGPHPFGEECFFWGALQIVVAVPAAND